MRLLLFILFLSFLQLIVKAQTVVDTSELKEVVVSSYFKDQPLLSAPVSVSIISSEIFRNQPGYSLLPAINTAPGVRMEERSPGSYRLSIRGSLLRSPFGIRNVKMYLDDFLLSDAGGNTYLNILDASGVGRIEILKGPEGSVFGANSGGVVLITSKSPDRDSSLFSAEISGGSFGLMQQNAVINTKLNNFEIGLSQAFQRSDGYRDNSGMNRKSIQMLPKWKYSPSAEVSTLILYSDLKYETPGGLTLAQVKENSRSARPGTPTVPGAEEQQASIFNKTFLAGIKHSKSFNNRLRHVISLTGSFTDFVNPFITTYETRKEESSGLRTYIELSSKSNTSGNWSWQTGAEAQQTKSQKRNYTNIKGEIGERQDYVDFDARQGFIFSHLSYKPFDRLTTEAAVSLNFYNYSFKSIYPVVSEEQKRDFSPQLMPRLALSYFLTDFLVIRGSASRGYSPPTIEEVRPSSREINTSLEPENSWNYESGLRLSLLNNRIYFDGVVFHYNLSDAIVRRVNASDSEFFVNAGGTKQTGLEAQLDAWVIPLRLNGFIRGVKISESYTLSKFKFDSYSINSSDFSGNKLTGVPQHNLVNSFNLYFPFNLNLYLQHTYVSSIPLNDANTVFADEYHLLQAKCNLYKKLKGATMRVFAGADNMLNSDYSLGNDLNAFGSRYFNPAASSSFYGGFAVEF